MHFTNAVKYLYIYSMHRIIIKKKRTEDKFIHPENVTINTKSILVAVYKTTLY